MNAQESLERFGTVAFDLELMRRLVAEACARRSSCPCCGGVPLTTLDLSAWFAFVPLCYRSDVARIVEEVGREFLGLKMTIDIIESLIGSIHRHIFAEMEWRDPE